MTIEARRQRISPIGARQLASLLLALIAALLLAIFSRPAAAQTPQAPEAATGSDAKPIATARRHMVSSANPLATDAGLEILRAGGSAVDAAITVQLVLNLVEPQSSGIGGGAFLLHWDPAVRRVRAYDGRETAPQGVTPDLFLKPDGTPRSFGEALLGGQSVGVPGVVAVLALAHARHGRLPWKRLFAPAIRLAETGFPVSPRLSRLLALRGPARFSPEARAYFFDADGRPRSAGEMLSNPAFAATLREIAENGADTFYKGAIAGSIVKAVREANVNRGTLTLDDMASYRAKVRPPVCVTYHRHRLCGMGPPSSGGLVTAMTLKLIEPYPLGARPMTAAAVHLIAEAEKLAYADRDYWIGDPDKVAVPTAGLVDPGYLLRRRRLLDLERAKPRAEPGLPPGALPAQPGPDATREQAGTSHISVVDGRGRAVALTTSIEAGFGSGLMAGGFLLNNQLTDFSFRPREATGAPAANAVAPGKRPRSSMSPTIVLDARGRFFAALGSPGGSMIPLYVVKDLVALIDWKLDAQRALALPNFGSRNGPLALEKSTDETLRRELEAMGHTIELEPMTSGSHVIVRRPGGTLEGGADPRREGIARGD